MAALVEGDRLEQIGVAPLALCKRALALVGRCPGALGPVVDRSALSAVQRSSSWTGTRRFRPRRISLSSGATLASKKSGPTPMAAAASAGLRAMRGIDTASLRAITR
jgi:hypothetical protein